MPIEADLAAFSPGRVAAHDGHLGRLAEGKRALNIHEQRHATWGLACFVLRAAFTYVSFTTSRARNTMHM